MISVRCPSSIHKYTCCLTIDDWRNATRDAAPYDLLVHLSLKYCTRSQKEWLLFSQQQDQSREYTPTRNSAGMASKTSDSNTTNRKCTVAEPKTLYRARPGLCEEAQDEYR
jgi:hypothetical protein